MSAGESGTSEVLAQLQAEHEAAVALLQALQAEREALREGSPERLDTAVADKTECLRSVERAGQALSRTVGSLGHDPARQPMRNWLADLEWSGQGLVARFDAMKSELERCDELNRRNGAVIEVSQQHVAAALGALDGTTGTTTRLYDASGTARAETAQPGSGGSIGTA